jgi:hypothetical protein
MESFHGYFHRYSYFQEGMWENKNIYGKFPNISLDIFIYLHSLPQMSMETFHGHFHRYFYFQERMWENKNVCGKFSWTFLQTFVFFQIPSDKCQ